LTTPQSPADTGHISHHTAPVDADTERMPLYSPRFATDPQAAYRELRARYGSMVPVDLSPGVPATLVIGYHTALQILHDPDRFPADPRIWQQHVPADCPALPTLRWRPNAVRSSGADHARYRQVSTASIDAVDLHALHAAVEQHAMPLINDFCAAGTADLVGQYAFPMAFDVVSSMLGSPPEIGRQIAAAAGPMLSGQEAEKNSALIDRATMELVRYKREQPGNDIVTRTLQHPAGLDDTEAMHQIRILYTLGARSLENLITKTILPLLADDRFGGPLLDGSMLTRDAVDEVLFNDPPLANVCLTYPRQPILIDDAWLPAHQPVVISIAACNNDPAISVSDRTGNRSHLAWGAGPHSCPARSAAYLIAQDAVDQLLDALPEMRLAIPAEELNWQPGPFQRTLTTLPVTFPATSAHLTHPSAMGPR
jgi:cytochrome P450